MERAGPRGSARFVCGLIDFGLARVQATAMIRLSILTASAVLAIAAAPAPLNGRWAGDRLSLKTLDDGAVIQGDCTSGKITAPIVLDASGNFTADGYFNRKSSGFQLGDIAPRDHAAHFTGRSKGDSLTLSMTLAGERAAKTFTLRRNARIAFKKCA